MRKTVASIVGLLLLLFTGPASAREREAAGTPQIQCGTDPAMRALYEAHPASKLEALEFETFTSALIEQGFPEQGPPPEDLSAAATTYTIPVVFHVFGTSYAGITINDALINDALNKLNQDFQGLTADWGQVSPRFAGVKRPLSITFKLAKRDQGGQPTTGITYHPTRSGFGHDSGYDAEIQQFAWDNYKYMNVYIMLDLYADGATNNSGVAWYPDTWMSNNNLARVVYNGRYIGTNTDENFRRVLTHEFGHYLNLIHTFEGGCTDPNDQVGDTPRTTSNSGSCNLSIQRCSGAGVPNGENFMDYSLCYRMFTALQVARMQAALQHPTRFPLWQPANLIATGVSDDPVVGVVADFSANQVRIPSGGSVTFANASQTEAGTTITSSQWTFPGGTPSSFSGANPPAITYNAEGVFDARLTVQNSRGATDTKLRSGYITVKNEYCFPNLRFGTYSHIRNVKFGTINNTTGESGVNDYTSQFVTNVNKGSAYTLSVTAAVGNSGSSDVIKIRAWMDWNHNWRFDANELVASTEFPASNGDFTFSKSITVPTTAVTAKTALRVLVAFKQGTEGDNPCDTVDSGESEDYGVNILGGSSCTTTISPTSASASATGGSGTVNVTTSATNCTWTSSSGASWLTITAGGGTRTGNGSISYSVAANSGSSSRTGTLTVAGKTFTVSQAGTSGGGTALSNGVARSVSGAQGSQALYYIDVPSGSTNLVMATSGGTGDTSIPVSARRPR